MSASDTKLTKLNIRPGINKNTTELDAEGTYVCCDKIRFYYGKPEKLGGWTRENYAGSVKGVARDALSWIDLDEQPYLGFGTNEKLYLLTLGTLYDITPIVASASGDDVINTCAGTLEVRVGLNPQGAVAGDYFVFATVTACAGDGVDFTSTYAITSVEPGSHFTFDASVTAGATSASAGGTTIVDFLLPTGRQSNGAAAGWGAGTWDDPGVSASAGWSDPRGGTGISVNMRQWDVDNWGEDQLALVEGGKVWFWEASAGPEQRATIMSSAAPSVANSMLVAQEGRHVILFGTHDTSGNYDPLLIRWSDSEDYTTWSAAATNQAGSFRLENGAQILGAQETRSEIVVFTDKSLYSMKRIGGQLVFGFTDKGNHNGLVSKHGSVDVNGRVYWMGYDSFHMYDGSIKTLPCSVQKFLFDPESDGSVNPEQKEKVFCETNRSFNEIWWFYPSKNSEECDRYVVYNYLENLFFIGTIDRSCFVDTGVFSKPYGFGTDQTIYIHEQGKDDDSGNLKAELLTSFFDIEDGDKISFVDRVVPDSTITKELNYTFNYKKYPQAPESFSKGSFTVSPTTRKIHPRVRGRQMQIKYSTSVQGSDFRIGSDRIAIKPDGER